MVRAIKDFRLIAFFIMACSLGVSSAFAQGGTIRITNISLYDLAFSSSPLLALDTNQGTCGRADQNGDGDTTDEGDFISEGFHDDLIGITITNDSSYTVRISQMSYRLSKVNGKRVRSKKIAPSSAFEIAAGEQKEVLFLFTKTVDDGTKQFIRSTSSLPTTLGFRSVSFKVRGRVANNTTVTLSGSTAISFGDVDRCSG